MNKITQNKLFLLILLFNVLLLEFVLACEEDDILGRNRNVISFDLHYPSSEQQIVLTSLQGIVNKQNPQLYFTNSSDDVWYHGFEDAQELWVQHYTQTKGYQFSEIATIEELVAHFKDSITGLIIYDSTLEGSVFNAMIYAGLENLLPVNESMLGTEGFNDFEVMRDLTGQWQTDREAYQWAIDNLLQLCNRNILYSVGNSIAGADYPISEQAFIHNLAYDNVDDLALIQQIYSYLNSPSAIYGWGKSESEDDFEIEKNFMQSVSQSGHFSIAIHKSNLSFHQKIESSSTFLQIQRPSQESFELENTTYVAFMMPEGDTAKILINFYAGHWLNEYRGQIPINWGMNPYIVSNFPAIAEYYYSTSSSLDYFFAPASGAGYIYLDLIPDIPIYAAHTEDFLSHADITIIDVWGSIDQIWDNPLADLSQYAEHCQSVDGFTSSFYHFKSENIQWVSNNTPVLSNGLSYWKMDVDMTEAEALVQIPGYTLEDYAEDLADDISDLASEKSKPNFVFVYLSMDAGNLYPINQEEDFYRNIPELLYKTTNLLDPSQFKPVCLDEMFAAIRLSE